MIEKVDMWLLWWIYDCYGEYVVAIVDICLLWWICGCYGGYLIAVNGRRLCVCQMFLFIMLSNNTLNECMKC